jgi:hypothetical protein
MANKDVEQIRRWLRGRGFEVLHGGDHYLVVRPSNPGRTVTMPTTPSDHRSLKNTLAQLKRTFDMLPDTACAGFPGTKTRAKTSMAKQCTGDRVISVLAELAGPKGEQIFAGRLHVEHHDGVQALHIANPFHDPESTHPVRSRASVVIDLPRANEPMTAQGLATLAVLGVDLEARTFSELQTTFLAVAREHRTEMIRDHQARKAERKSVADIRTGTPSAPRVDGFGR